MTVQLLHNWTGLSWQTRMMCCFTPTVLYTKVDAHRDKLATDDHHQFDTLSVHLSWQHLWRLTCSRKIFSKSRVGVKVPDGCNRYRYFWTYPNYQSAHSRKSRVASVPRKKRAWSVQLFGWNTWVVTHRQTDTHQGALFAKGRKRVVGRATGCTLRLFKWLF